ncbi:MAG: hypothetical protein KAJ51_12630 [Thermoplasmata archaeon]|nr:hypothetical protein [Thermoplasmata archaeon]
MAVKKVSNTPSPSQPPQPPKIMRAVPTRKGHNILWQGVLLYFGAVLVITLGIIGYLEYETLIEPNLNVFVCCVPSIIIAAILIFFGFATRMNVVRAVRRPGTIVRDYAPDPKSRQGMDKPVRVARRADVGRVGDLKRYQSPNVTKEELVRKKDNLTDFIKNLDEQHNSGLLFDETYLELKSKYQYELNDLNKSLKYFEDKSPKPKKGKK